MKAGYLGVILLLAFVVWWLPDPRKEHEKKSESPLNPEIRSTPPDNQPVLADDMLEGYGSEDSSDPEDLRRFARFLDSVFLLVKQRDTSDYATNPDLALFLLGSNSHQSPFLRKDSPALNDRGELVDRHGIPLIVHPISRKLLEIRFAGPDRKPYTSDDLLWPSPGQ